MSRRIVIWRLSSECDISTCEVNLIAERVIKFKDDQTNPTLVHSSKQRRISLKYRGIPTQFVFWFKKTKSESHNNF